MSIASINNVSGIGEHHVDVTWPKIAMVAGAALGICIIAVTYHFRKRYSQRAVTLTINTSFLFTAICIYKLIAFRNVTAPIVQPNVRTLFKDHATCRMTKNSFESHHVRLNMIQAAKESIVFAASYAGGEALDELLDAISDQLQHGIVVEFSVDPAYLTDVNTRQIHELNKHPNFHGIILSECFFYDDAIFSLPKPVFYHVKGLSIDGGQQALTGGSSSSGSKDPDTPRTWLFDGKEDLDQKDFLGIAGFHDADIVWESDTDWPSMAGSQIDQQIRQMHALARQRQSLPAPDNWPEFATPDQPADGTIVELHPIAPEQTENLFTEALIQKIDTETKSITFDHMYFHPTDDMIDALVAAVDRGVTVRIIHNKAGDDAPLTHYLYVNASRRHIAIFKEQTEHKERICAYEYNHDHITLHKKIVLFESQEAVAIGSANISSNSMRGKKADYELSMIVTDSSLYEEVSQDVQVDINASKNPEPLTCKQRFLGEIQRLLQPIL